MVFALMAILAPVIAPYPRLYEAPLIDRFDIHSFSRALPQNQSYEGPLVGPTTPLFPDVGGGEWMINWNTTRATVYMDFIKYPQRTNESPFLTRNLSLRLDATQLFNASPLPSPPLSAIYWIAPGKNISFETGPPDKNGALAYFMKRDFIVGDPFTNAGIFRVTLPFDPVWTGQDPESAGYLVAQPNQRQGPSPFPGVPGNPYGPYRYFYASNGSATMIFEITYVHTGDQTPTITPSGRIALSFNGTLSAPPFVYYHWATVSDVDSSGFRAGAGQAILLPLANHTLAVYNVSGIPRAYVPLTLFGQPAEVVAPIGYARSPDTATFFTYLQLRSSNASAIATFDMGRLRIAHVFPLAKASLELLQAPISEDGTALYLGFYDASAASTIMIGLNANQTSGNLTAISEFRLTFPGRVNDYFTVATLVSVYVFENARLVKLPTTFKVAGAIHIEEFGLTIPPGVKGIVYAGTTHGLLYGVSLSQEELNGAWTDSSTGKTTLFTLLGKPRVPLAPGTYPSGNSYLLGTDFNGHDILTQLLYGTQVAFIVGILAALFGVGIGTFVGVIAGYYGKMIDTLLMRTTDIFLVLPFLPVVLVLVSIARPSIWIIIFVLSALGWPGIARVIRAQVLSLKERPFVDAARVAGASDTRLIFLHLTPNVLPFSFLYMSLGVAAAIITEAALSYLGLGDPNVTSWGGMLSTLITLGGGLYYWWWLLPPGLAITFLSLGFYLLGRGFDEIINPRLRRR